MGLFMNLEKTLNDIERQFKPYVEDFEGFNKYLERNKETLKDRIREMEKIINKNLCLDLDIPDFYDWNKIVLESIKLDQYAYVNPPPIEMLKELAHEDLNIKMLKDLVEDINTHKMFIDMVRLHIEGVNIITSSIDETKGKIEHLKKVYTDVVDWGVPRISEHILRYHIKRDE